MPNKHKKYRKQHSINSQKQTKVFDDGTISIMNDMLRNTVINGSAKKLSFCNAPLYAKTGTVGSENGNTDAYTISYNSDYILGTWFGNKYNQFLDNSITGGSYPAMVSSEIWNELYKNCTPPDEIEISENVREIEIDKISYENDNIIVLADTIAPSLYKKTILIKNNYKVLERSTRFSSPKLESANISVNNNDIIIRLCMTKCINAKIFKTENGKKIEVYDSLKNKSNEYIEKNILTNKTYSFSVVPYYIADGKTYYGKEFYLEKIKSPTINAGDNWWDKNIN